MMRENFFYFIINQVILLRLRRKLVTSQVGWLKKNLKKEVLIVADRKNANCTGKSSRQKLFKKIITSFSFVS